MKTKTQIKHKGANGFEMALFIPYDSTWAEMPYIHSILASLDYSTHWLVFTEIKTPIYATLRFDLRLPDAMTGAPKDESLIDGGIIFPSCQKLGKDGVSLSRPIPFPQTGVFVVVEWITTAQVSESCNRMRRKTELGTRKHSLQSKAAEPSVEAWIGCRNRTNLHIRMKRHRYFIKAGYLLPNSV